MQLTIKDRIFTYDPTVDTVAKVIADIEQVLEETKMVWGSMKVDGTVMYDINECLEYIQDHFQAIQQLVLEVKSSQELQDETLQSMEHYLKRAIPELNNLSDAFYQGANADHWNQFANFADGLNWLLHAEHFLQQAGRIQADQVYLLGLQDILPEFEQAVESKDEVLIADLIAHEIAPAYALLSKKVIEIIDNEVVRHDLN